MDRRAAGALLALAACFACSAAAPTASNQTALDLYEGAQEGCYYNFQHYGEGDRIMTNEPCLNCTCHNRMLMCYLRVCPFTKAIGQDCTVEKRADQCCPIVTCPDVPVDLLTSTSTTSPAEYGATGLGKLDKYGCSISGKYFPEGSKVPPTPNKPCEHCYCIRNMTTCVMQECTLHVDGCTPIYHKDVCCPVRYSCDHPEDEVPLLDDMSTTVRPTPGFLLTTTTISPVTQMTQDCIHDDRVFSDGALIKTEKACEHCYCMKGDIVCVVQECGAPMENEGKNCTSLPPREGQCCPDTYICEGDELTSDLPTESTTESIIEKLTTLSPPRRTSVEGSGYRNEPDEAPYTDMPEVEGSGEEEETSKPFGPDEIIPTPGDDDQYIYVTTKRPAYEEGEKTTLAIDKNIIPDIKDKTSEPHVYLSTTPAPVSEEVEKLTTSGIIDEAILEPHKHAPTTKAPESVTTELGDLQNTVPDVIPDEEIAKPHEYAPSTTNAPTSESLSPIEGEDDKLTTSEKDVIMSATSKPEFSTTISSTSDEIEKETDTPTHISNVTPEVITEKESTDGDITRTTIATSAEEGKETSKPELLSPSSTISTDKESTKPEELAPSTTSSSFEEEQEIYKPDQLTPSTTSSPPEEEEKITTELDHAQNTVAVSEEDSTHPHSHISTTWASSKAEEESTTALNLGQDVVTDEVTKEGVLAPDEHFTTAAPSVKETEFTTAEPDRGLNTIPSAIYEETSSESPLPGRTTISEETKETEPSIITDEMQTQGIEIKSTTDSDLTTPLPDSSVTKGDQFTITTEPSFRKEDEGIVSTEKPKEIGSTTVKSEFVDEGLIPTSSHDDKIGSSDAPTAEEDFTTSVPEYITEVAETIESKQTTTESPKETSIVTEILPEKVSKPSSEPDGDLPDTTDKQTEVTPVVEIHEEPSRIPGEGDCLLNGVTYRNNTVVPSTNNCHTGCRCASSIIKCDPIICSPPPDYMDNCQSIYDSPDSCCPTFVCDHPRETVPPQSDNQMSGTESPMPSPTIECRGDQCEISVPTKEPTGPSEPCTSGSCLTASDHKTETECGSEGCGDVSQKPDTSLPSVQPTEDCTDGKCKPESCVYGECQSTQTQVSPVTPCEGEHCEKSDEFVPGSPQQCNNEEDCKTIKIPTVDAVPCEGELCNKIDCADGNCDSDVSAPLPDHQMEPCKDEDGCKPQDIPVPECTGDEPCRRKEVSASDTKIPTTCEGPNCISEKETTSAQGVIDLSTESPKLEETPSEEATEKIEVEKTTELPDSYISKPADDKIPTKDTQEPDMYTTEGQTDKTFTSVDSQKEKPVVEDETTKTTTAIETMVEGDEKTPGAKEEITQKPIIIEKEETEAPNVIDAETTKPTTLVTEGEEPTIDEEKGTEKPIVVKDKDTKEPTLIDDEGKEKPAVIEKEGPEPLLIDREKDTEKPVMIDEDTKDTPYLGSTKKPDIIDEEEGMTKPVTTAEETTTIPDTEKKETDAPAIIDEISTNIPADTDEISKDKPVDTEKDTEKPIIVDEEGKPTDIDVKDKDKPEQEPVEKISSEKPALIEKEGTDKNAVEEATENPDVIKEETTVKTIVPDKDEKEKPDDGKDETTEELTIIEEKSTETPASVSDDDKPAIVEEDGKEKPAIIDETSTGKPIAEDTDKKPVTFEHGDTEKPTPVDKESTEKPLLEQDVKTEPAIVDQESTERIMTSDDLKPETSTETEGEPKEKPAVVAETTKPDLIDEEKSSENPLVTIVDGSETTPAIVDKDTDKPVLVDKDGIKKPAVIEIEGTTPTDIEVERTELPVDVGEENTQMPVIIDEQSTIIPITEGDTLSILKEESTVAPEETEEKGTAKPFIIDEGTEEPNIIEKEDATKPALIEREGTELPAVIGEEGTDKPLLIDEETKEKPDLTDQEDTKITAMVEKETDKPGVIEEGTEEPSTFETEATVKPALIDEAGKPVDDDDAKKPIQVEEEKHQEKPVVDKKEDKPIIIDEEITDKPIVDEVVSTEEPKKHEEEGSGTEIPEALHTVEPEKEVSPEITDTTITEIERTTKIPYSESQTTIVHETPEIMVTDTVTKEPFIHDYSRIPEITTESLIEQQMTTKTSVPEQEKITISEQQVEVTTFKVDTSDVKEEGSTVGQDLISEEPALTTKAPVLHETSESTEKTTEMGLTSEPEEISTDTSEIESPATRAPGTVPVIIEPQEGIDADKPEPHVTSKTEEESTTKVYEEDKIKPSSESHVTEASSTSPEYETSDGITDVSEITDEHKPKPQSPELVTELDRTTTQVSPLEIKTDHPEIYVSDKQEPGTETQGYSVTEPVRRVTDIEDISVTGQEEIATGYPEVTKDHHVPSATDKIDESGDVGITSSEKPLLTDMETQDLPEKSLESDKPVTKVPEDYQTPEAEKEKPIDEIVSPATEIPISIVTESHETSDVPEKDVSSYVDKSTIIPDLSDHKHKDTTPPIGYTDQQELDTEIPQHHVTSTEEEMKVSEPYVTEPYITEPQETSTKSVEQEIKDSQTITTDIPSISDKEGETETRAPELMHTGSHDLEPSVTEMQKLSTDLPISSEDVLTELPGVQISSEAPQSLVTEQKESLGEQTTVSIIPKEESSYKPDLLTTQFEEISKGPEQHVTEKEVQTEAPIHVTEQVEVSTVKPEEGDKITHVFEEAVTDKQDTATTLRESPAVTDKIEQIEVMKSTEHTSAQTEFSETTPYLIELQEHTHKIVEDITTVSPSEEEHTDKLVEDTSTPSPSEDEHSYKPVEDITTPSPSEEEHSYKPVEDISTSSPSEEEHSYKPVEDISTPSPSEEEHSYKPVEDISTSSPSEEEHSYKPVGDISTSSTSEEHSYKPVEDISTSSPSEEEHSYKPVEDISTSSPSEEEHSYKPVEDISTSSPSEEEHSYKPVEDISTSSPSEEEHSYKPVEDISTSSPSEEEHSYKPVEDISTSSPSEEEHSYKPVEDISTSSPSEEEHSYKPVEDISTSSPSEEEHSYKPVEDISTSLPAEEEHSHKPVEDISTSSPSEDEHSYKPVEEISTSSPSQEEHSYKPVQDISTSPPPTEEYTPQTEEHVSELTTKKTGEEIETATKETEATISESVPVEETTPVVIQGEDSKYTADHKEYTTAVPTQISEDSTPAVSTGTEKLPISESDIAISTEKEISTSERPSHPIVSHETTPPEEEFIFSTTKATTISQEEDIVTPVLDDKFGKPEEKPTETSEVPPSSTTTEVSKPGVSDLQPTDEIPVPDEDGHFPPSGTSGYGEPDYVEEDQAFGPGTCRYGGKVYVSAQQIPRDDPCDFCFCFRSDIICLQQSCPPPIHGCHEEPIQGFCCPRYECPVSMATTVNVTTTTTTTTTTVPPNFPTHSYKGAAQRRGCQIKGHTYKVGEVVRSSSGPCLHCTCGGDGQMKCDPKACTPEPMLRQMIAAAVSAKRRR